MSLVSVVRCLCDGPIPRPEECYRLWCVIACEVETSKNEATLILVWHNEVINHTSTSPVVIIVVRLTNRFRFLFMSPFLHLLR